LQDRSAEDRAEHRRIQSVYESYERDPAKQRAWADGAANRFQMEGKWRLIRAGLARASLRPAECRILDLGVGGGSDCGAWMEEGVRPQALIALDLNRLAVRAARARYAWLRALTGDATRLPFGDGAFDLVYQSTMITSVLDPALRAAILREVGRVVRRGGLFISYDMRYPNPWNRNTRPLLRRELRRAFGGWTMHVSSVTGIPQVVRALSGVSLRLCRWFEAVPVFRSHLLVLLRKP
jgi:SAM-dependent methyltransferase